MTVKQLETRNEITGVAGQTEFNYSFLIFNEDEISVYVTPNGQVANDSTDEVTPASVSGVGNPDGGTVTLNDPVNDGDKVTLVSNVPNNRSVDYQNNEDFNPKTVNADIDKTVSIAKQARELANRGLINQRSQQGQKPLDLPEPVAGKLLRWKQDLTGMENVDQELSPQNLTVDGVFDSVADMTAAANDQGLLLRTKKYYSGTNNAEFGDGYYLSLSSSDYQIYTGLTSPDELKDHTDAGGNILMLLPENGIIGVQQCGAIPFDDTQSVADTNRDAFRSAHISNRTEWEALATAASPRIWTTKVESGDYNLSNGYSVPKGMVSFCDSLGAARVKQLPGTVDANPALPTVSLGRVIDGTGTALSFGIYVTNPPPKIHNLYINPQDVRIGVDVDGIPGFEIGDLWLQAAICINFGDNTSDGIIGRIFLETGSNRGLVFNQCQSLVIDEIYSFDMQTPIEVAGNCNTVDIGLAQLNFSQVAPVQFNDGTESRAVTINKLIVNQNAQFGGFTSCVRLRSASCDLRIDEMECYNYNGFAVNNETGLGNKVNIGRAKLRQQRNNDLFTQGTDAQGFRANNCQIRIGSVDTDTIADSVGIVAGTFQSILRIDSATLGGQTASNPVVNISNTASNSSVLLTDIQNNTGQELINSQSSVAVSFKRITNPFQIVAEGGRNAIKIPFRSASCFDFTLRANTNPGGNPAYRKVRRSLATTEKGFTAALEWNAELTDLFNSSYASGFVPQIDLQIDIGTVGAGSTVPSTNNDLLVLSWPTSYTGITYVLEEFMTQ